ncbi:hypothetical protein [Bauldia litoralis]|uniref:hypothetical protein n=1 Tax=Bauldia litoralis TaxID=665467 RepID=UPI0032674DAD
MAKASEAQAKAIANLWSGWQPYAIADVGYVNPTWKSCVKNGWFVPTGKTGHFPNGNPYQEHTVSPAGLQALAQFLLALQAQEAEGT